MKMISRPKVAALLVAAGLALTSPPRLSADERAGHSNPRSLVGTWRVRVTLYDCATGVARPPFWSMLTFAKGGTVTGTTNNAAFAPGQRTGDHGVWRATGGRDYRVRSEAFILFDTTPTPPAPGFRRGVQRITQNLRLHAEDEFLSGATVEFFDAAGALLGSGCAQAVGQRME